MLKISYESFVLIFAFIFTGKCGVIVSRAPANNLLDKIKLNAKDGTYLGDGNDDLGPPDHLDAVKVERDGHINEDFHQEIFLGEEKHKFHDISEEDQKKRLEEIFSLVDINIDKFIQEEELLDWIFLKTQEHLQEATKDAEKKFAMVDLEKNGKIEYNDFLQSFKEHFEKKHGINDKERYQRRLDTIGRAWKTADLDNDNQLDKDEFVLFQHPELSKNSLNENVDFFLTERDFNEDGFLNITEFVFGFPVGEIDIELMKEGDDLLRDRVHQFESLLDTNHDNKGSREELMVFFDPMSKINARNDAHEMVWFADTDSNGKLSLQEVIEASEYFTGTKLYGIERYFHNEL